MDTSLPFTNASKFIALLLDVKPNFEP